MYFTLMSVYVLHDQNNKSASQRMSIAELAAQDETLMAALLCLLSDIRAAKTHPIRQDYWRVSRVDQSQQ